MSPIRLGVIGAGLIWLRAHGPILETLDSDFIPVAFCDTSPERRAAAAERFPAAAVVADHHELLALPEVDAALVLTPIALNAPIAADALRAGKHVIMEKPIARSTAEGRALIELAHERDRTLCVAEQMGYHQAETVIAETIASGAIGDLVGWNWTLHIEDDRAAGEMRFDSTPWRKQADFPLGTMFDGGIHLIAGLSRIFGPPQAVAASGRKLRPEYGAYDQIAAMFRYPGGASGALSYSTYLPQLVNHRHIYGTTGTIILERERLRILRPNEHEQEIALPAEHASRRMWHVFADVFRHGATPDYTPEMALRDVAILEAVAKAIETGQMAQVLA